MSSKPTISVITIDNSEVPDHQPTQENSPATATRSHKLAHQRSPSEAPVPHDEPLSPTESASDLITVDAADIANPAPFAFRPKELAEMAEKKDMEALGKMGGPEGLLRGLGTYTSKGLSGHAIGEGTGGGEDPFSASMDDRKRVYGINQIPVRKSKSLLQLMWLALQDKVPVLLRVTAVASLAFGLYQDLGTNETVPCATAEEPGKRCPKFKVDFAEGVAIAIAVLIVVLVGFAKGVAIAIAVLIVGSLNDWQKERQFRALNEMNKDRAIRVNLDLAEAIKNLDLDEAIKNQKATVDLTPADDERGREERQRELERLLERRLQSVGGRKSELWSSLRASIAVPTVLGGAKKFYELVKDKLFEDLQQLSTGIKRPKHLELFATIRRMETAILCLKLQDGDKLCQDIFKASTRLGVYCQALKHQARDATSHKELETLYKVFVRIEREFSAAHDRISSKYEQLYKQWKGDRQSISKYLFKIDSTKSQSDNLEVRALMEQVDAGFERVRNLLNNEANYLKNLSETLSRFSKLVYPSPDPPIASGVQDQISSQPLDYPSVSSNVSKQVDAVTVTLSRVDALVEKSRYTKARKAISETLSKTMRKLKEMRTRSEDYGHESQTLSCPRTRQNDNLRNIWNRKLGLCNQLSNHVGEMRRMLKAIEKGFSGCKASIQGLVFRPLGGLLCDLGPYLPQAGLEVSSKGLHPDLTLYEAAFQAIADSIPAQSELLEGINGLISVLDKLRAV